MDSIRLRLIALFVLLVTVTLGASGLYGQLRLAAELETRFAERQKETLNRLKTSLPSSLWNIDELTAERIVQAEMKQEEVVSIKVLNAQSEPFVSLTRTSASSTPLSLQDPSTHPMLEADVRVDQGLDTSLKEGAAARLAGRVQVTFSREQIENTLRTQMMTRLIEIVLLDALLVVALIVSLKMVFEPIGQLRDALLDLAAHEGEDAEELPETSKNEFGEVIRGFNLTQRKLRQVISRRAQAEEAAREAATKTELAYRELQDTQESLVQSEKLAGLGGMVAGIAHEINTPVGIVVTSASVLEEATAQIRKAMDTGGVRKSDINAYLETAGQSTALILTNAARAAHLIQSFKQVAVDQTSDQRREFELRQYLGEVTTSLHPSLRKAHTSVDIVCADGVVMDSYPGLLAQVLTNLTMNAITHAFAEGTEGHIQITVTPAANDSITLDFSDDGCGIPAEHLAKVFDPFFTTRRGKGGTGLGLNIVFNIVSKQLGGSIVVSNNADMGALFKLTLPRITPDM
jgi:two-component system NtrC family sensor kinase